MTDAFARPQAPWALRLVPPFPAIAQRVLALTSVEDVSIRELGDLIKMDPSFSAELLRFANSALFNMRREVTSLAQAIMMSGTERVKTMATLVAINRMIRSSVQIAALRKVWNHSLATAVIAEEAARSCGLQPEAAYTGGLLHNLGTLGLMSAYPSEYSRMLEVSDDFGFDLLQTERDLFEIDHCAAGAYIAQDWCFPDELVATIATHHNPPVPREASVNNIVCVSWRLGEALGFAAFSPELEQSWEDLAALLPETRSSWLGGSQEEVIAEVAARLAAVPS